MRTFETLRNKKVNYSHLPDYDTHIPEDIKFHTHENLKSHRNSVGSRRKSSAVVKIIIIKIYTLHPDAMKTYPVNLLLWFLISANKSKIDAGFLDSHESDH